MAPTPSSAAREPRARASNRGSLTGLQQTTTQERRKDTKHSSLNGLRFPLRTNVTSKEIVGGSESAGAHIQHNHDRRTSLAQPPTPSDTIPQRISGNNPDEEDIVEQRADGINIVRIGKPGDLILEVSHEATKENILFSVNSEQLIVTSPYFGILLDSHKFQEGIAFAKRHDELRKIYQNQADIPFTELPRVQITDIGRISHVKSIQPLMTDFFRALHKQDVSTRREPSGNMANLAVVADCFDAVPAVSLWVGNNMIMVRPKTGSSEETYLRHRVFLGMLFGHEPWLLASSMQLVMQGSTRWIKPGDLPKGLWWDLPRGVEEELQFRRECILETLDSLQAYVLSLYTEGTQMCKLGYDTSPQCDSFQLGLYTRYLKRSKLLDLRSTFFAAPENDPYEGDVSSLLDKLRSCPSYQIDQLHSHCGPRKILLGGLSIIADLLSDNRLGICVKCLEDKNLPDYLWTSSNAPLFYDSVALKQYRMMKSPSLCARFAAHENAKEFFMAEDKSWESLLARFR